MSICAAIGLAMSFALGGLMARMGTGRMLAAAFAAAIAGNLLALALPADVWAVLASRALEGLSFAVFAIAGPLYTNRNAGPAHLPLAIALSAIWIPVDRKSTRLNSSH